MILIFGAFIKAVKKGIKGGKKFVRSTIPLIKPFAGTIGTALGGPGGAQAARSFITTAEELTAKRRRTPAFSVTRGPSVPAVRRISPPVSRLARAATGGIRRALPSPRSVPAIAPGPRAILRPPPPVPQGAILMPKLRRRVGGPPQGFEVRIPPAIKDPIGTIRRALPIEFGSGRATLAGGGFGTITPISDTVDKLGRPIVVEPKVEDRMRCPPGYLVITMPDGSPACALAGVAIAAGLARRRRKPLISVKETRALMLAARAQSKIDKVHKRFGTKPRAVRRRSK